MMKHGARFRRLRPRRLATWVCRSMQLVAVSCIASALPAPAEAQSQDEAPTKASCAQAYESAQESRASGQLQQTRERLAFCARVECPSFVQKDCARWLEEVDRELPSVIITAQGLSATDAAEVTVKLDGQIVTRGLSGEPLKLDPGAHELLIEHSEHEPITRKIMAQQGVQKRIVEVRFAPTETSDAAPLDLDEASGSPLRPYAFAAWGVGAVGIGVFAVLGTLGRADQDAFKQDCAQGWTDDETMVRPGVCLMSENSGRKDDYERKFLFADIGLVTGIAGLAAGTALFIWSEASDSASDDEPAADDVSFDVQPIRGGAAASFKTSF